MECQTLSRSETCWTSQLSMSRHLTQNSDIRAISAREIFQGSNEVQFASTKYALKMVRLRFRTNQLNPGTNTCIADENEIFFFSFRYFAINNPLKPQQSRKMRAIWKMFCKSMLAIWKYVQIDYFKLLCPSPKCRCRHTPQVPECWSWTGFQTK